MLPGPYESEDASLDSYQANRDGTTLYADTPISLLGLAAIHEHHHPHEDKPYWWTIQGPTPDLHEQLQDDVLEASFLNYLEEKPEKAKAEMRKAIEEAEIDPSVGAHDRIGVSKALFEKLVKESFK